MLSLHKYGNAETKKINPHTGKAQSAIEYLKSVLAADLDYYLKKGEVPKIMPEFVGGGISALGLTMPDVKGKPPEEVTAAFERLYAQLEALAQARDPRRLDGPGEPPSLLRNSGGGKNHMVGVDMTFSLPKSVSLAYAAGNDADKALIHDLHMAAIREVMTEFVEKEIQTRRGKDGLQSESVKGITACLFPHFSSRSLDPQLHVHGLVFNLGLGEDDQWRTIETSYLFYHKAMLGALYRSSIAHKLAEAGFTILEDKPTKAFKLEGISDEACEKLSTRRAEILEAQERTGMNAQAATLATRREKAEPPYEELMHLLRERALEVGLTEETIAKIRQVGSTIDANWLKDPAVEAKFKKDLLDSLTEQVSVFERKHVMTAVAIASVGKWNLAEVRSYTTNLLASEDLIELQRRATGERQSSKRYYTTERMYHLEAAIRRAVKEMTAKPSHQVALSVATKHIEALEKEIRASANNPNIHLTEQRAAVNHVLCNSGSFVTVVGDAGTGKTTMALAITRAYRDPANGKPPYEILGGAIAGKAADGLQKDAEVEASTLHSLLTQIENGSKKLNSRSILIIDEAGMLGSVMMGRIIDKVHRAGAKMIVIGDYKQLQAVEAGGIMRSLMNVAGEARRAELADLIRAGENPFVSPRGEPRAAVIVPESWALPEIDGGNTLDEQGRADMSLIRDALAKANGKLVIAGSQEHVTLENTKQLDRVEALSGHMHLKNIQRQRDDDDKDIVRHYSIGKELPFQLARLDQKGRVHVRDDMEQTQEDMAETYHRTSGNLKSKLMLAATNKEVTTLNQLARAKMIEDGRVKGPQARVYFNAKKTFYVDLAAGDRVVFKRNHKQVGVKNGSFGVVKKVTPNADGKSFRVDVELDHAVKKGREVVSFSTKQFRDIDLGYCSTVHKSQGMTVENCFFLATEAASRELTYVAMSRARGQTHVFAANPDLEEQFTEEIDRRRENGEKITKSLKEKVMRDLVFEEIGVKAARSAAKDTSLDYVLSDNPNKKPPAISTKTLAESLAPFQTPQLEEEQKQAAAREEQDRQSTESTGLAGTATPYASTEIKHRPPTAAERMLAESRETIRLDLAGEKPSEAAAKPSIRDSFLRRMGIIDDAGAQAAPAKTVAKSGEESPFARIFARAARARAIKDAVAKAERAAEQQAADALTRLALSEERRVAAQIRTEAEMAERRSKAVADAHIIVGQAAAKLNARRQALAAAQAAAQPAAAQPATPVSAADLAVARGADSKTVAKARQSANQHSRDKALAEKRAREAEAARLAAQREAEQRAAAGDVAKPPSMRR